MEFREQRRGEEEKIRHETAAKAVLIKQHPDRGGDGRLYRALSRGIQVLTASKR